MCPQSRSRKKRIEKAKFQLPVPPKEPRENPKPPYLMGDVITNLEVLWVVVRDNYKDHCQYLCDCRECGSRWIYSGTALRKRKAKRTQYCSNCGPKKANPRPVFSGSWSDATKLMVGEGKLYHESHCGIQEADEEIIEKLRR